MGKDVAKGAGRASYRLKGFARHGIQTWATCPSDSEPAAGEPTCCFPIPIRLIFCGVAKALSLIVISPVSEPLLCGWNCTSIAQLFLIVSFMLQLLCSMKLPALCSKATGFHFPHSPAQR
jgi:hypothetical protein